MEQKRLQGDGFPARRHRLAAAPKEKTSWRLFLYGIINARLKRKGQSPSEAYAFIDGYRQRTTRAADMV